MDNLSVLSREMSTGTEFFLASWGEKGKIVRPVNLSLSDLVCGFMIQISTPNLKVCLAVVKFFLLDEFKSQLS